MASRVMTLNDGSKMPAIAYGVGTAHLSKFRQVFGIPDFDSTQLIADALNMGYRHIDTAEQYQKDAEVAAALKNTDVPRRELFITSKVLCTNGFTIDEALTQQLSRLGLDYLDLYLIHNPRCANNDKELQTKWKEMEAAQRSGRVKSIGVSNFTAAQLQPILEVATIRPAVNQLEYHAYEQHGDLVTWMKSQGIMASCYSSLAPVIRGRPGPVDGKFGELAKKYGVEDGDIAVKWCLDQGLAVATTGRNLDRLKRYLDDFDKFRLTAEEVEDIKQLGLQKKFSNFMQMGGGPEY